MFAEIAQFAEPLAFLSYFDSPPGQCKRLTLAIVNPVDVMNWVSFQTRVVARSENVSRSSTISPYRHSLSANKTRNNNKWNIN